MLDGQNMMRWFERWFLTVACEMFVDCFPDLSVELGLHRRKVHRKHTGDPGAMMMLVLTFGTLKGI